MDRSFKTSAQKKYGIFLFLSKFFIDTAEKDRGERVDDIQQRTESQTAVKTQPCIAYNLYGGVLGHTEHFSYWFSFTSSKSSRQVVAIIFVTQYGSQFAAGRRSSK